MRLTEVVKRRERERERETENEEAKDNVIQEDQEPGH